MTYESVFKPSKDGNSVETEIVIADIQYKDCGEMIPAQRVLVITTSKDATRKVLKVGATVSTVYQRTGANSGQSYTCRTHAFSFDGTGDYMKTVVTGGAKPATEKNLQALHDSALQSVAMLIEDVKAHYAKKETV